MKNEETRKKSLMELDVDDINIVENLRTGMGELSELMNSIKAKGVLQPIGVWDCNGKYNLVYGHRRLIASRKLGLKTIPAVVTKRCFNKGDFIIENTVENLMRQDISPIELGKVCMTLYEDHNMSKTEIASRLSVPLSRVQMSMDLYRNVPQQFREHIGFVNRNMAKKGTISASTSQAIANSRISKSDATELFEMARKEELTSSQIRMITKIKTDEDSTIKQSYEKMDLYRLAHIDIILNKKELAKMLDEYPTMSISKILSDMLKGKKDLWKNLVL